MQPKEPFKERRNQFVALADAAANGPTAEQVHDLRVLTRRLRSYLWLMPKESETKCVLQARSDLKALGHVLSAQRTYDVALADARRFGAPRKLIKRRLKEARARVKRALTGAKRRRYATQLRRANRKLKRDAGEPQLTRLVQLSVALARAKRRPPRSTQARHRLRINVKKARYALETFGHPVTALSPLQDCLGRWHDLIVLGQLVGLSVPIARASRKEWEKAEHHLRLALPRAIRALQTICAAQKKRAPSRGQEAESEEH